jgi:hypothetical protein
VRDHDSTRLVAAISLAPEKIEGRDLVRRESVSLALGFFPPCSGRRKSGTEPGGVCVEADLMNRKREGERESEFPTETGGEPTGCDGH